MLFFLGCGKSEEKLAIMTTSATQNNGKLPLNVAPVADNSTSLQRKNMKIELNQTKVLVTLEHEAKSKWFEKVTE